MTIRETREYLETHSTQEASIFFDVSVRTIGRWRQSLGVQGKWSRNAPKKLIAAFQALGEPAVRDIISCSHSRAAGRQLGVSRSTVCAWRQFLNEPCTIASRKTILLAILQTRHSPINGKTMAALAGISLNNALDGLRNLEKKGIVRSQKIGKRALLWSLTS